MTNDFAVMALRIQRQQRSLIAGFLLLSAGIAAAWNTQRTLLTSNRAIPSAFAAIASQRLAGGGGAAPSTSTSLGGSGLASRTRGPVRPTVAVSVARVAVPTIPLGTGSTGPLASAERASLSDTGLIGFGGGRGLLQGTPAGGGDSTNRGGSAPSLGSGSGTGGGATPGTGTDPATPGTPANPVDPTNPTNPVDPATPGTPISSVPEPDTWLLTIFGFAVTGSALRRRKRLAADAQPSFDDEAVSALGH